MISWLLVIVIAYLFFSLSSLGDKLVLAGKPKPASYTFYVGILGAFVIVCIPFIAFTLPSPTTFAWMMLDALVHLIGLYTMFVAVEEFEVSKVIATIGATQPIFILGLTWIFWGFQAMPAIDMLAFVLLLVGSIIISAEKSIKLTSSYLKITLLSSLMFALDYIFSKFVFLDQAFLPGIIWIRIIVFIMALVFLMKKSSRKEIFTRQTVSNKNTQLTFIGTQIAGGAANLLQSFAIFLAPISFLATVNSLRGIQYIFLFLITLFLSVFFPNILKEEISKKILIQKIISIILIVAGLALMVIN